MIIINILDNIFHKLVVAAFIIFVTFVIFISILYYMYFAVSKTVASVLVNSRLDYCNSLYHNIALKDILKLQRVQNSLARAVTRSPRFSHSLPLLKSLHWLPVQYHIIFKVCAVTYQAHSSMQLAYLHSLLTPPRQPRLLIYFLFPVLRQMSELELFQLLHRLCGTHSLLLLSL